jgi:hypothetical protein
MTLDELSQETGIPLPVLRREIETEELWNEPENED